MVEAPESARDDNARRDRIALCGGAAMSAAYHQAYIEEYDTAQLEIVAVRLAQLAQCTCTMGLLMMSIGLAWSPEPSH